MTAPNTIKQSRKPNRLINEKSPYLLQHAYNPVDWFPWGEEAFEKAKLGDKSIFLSIGYSSCHWCHVMEHESFEDVEVAALLNEKFVCIKVDREERPDIDSIYMTTCQMMTGSGGWPLTILMTPEKMPFFAGTYFPKNSMYGRPGLMDILNSISKAWLEKRNDLIKSSQVIKENIENATSRYTPGEIGKDTIYSAYHELGSTFDKTYGGFSPAPKFPIPHIMRFLLRYNYSTGGDKTIDMVEETLTSMYKGGIFDHIGGGFSRYSTDEKWLVPHFEKMLYDNALLSYAYVECFQATNKELYASITRKVFEYVLTKMASSDGVFYSAEDADSEGVEGKFYLWEYDEVIDVLGEKDGIEFCRAYNISKNGNFEGKNIPNLIGKEIKDHNYQQKIQSSITKLFEYREKRIHPYKDDKILTSWNGLMIASLSYGGRVLKDNTYIEAAKKAVEFIYNNMFNADGRLLARFRDGEAAYLAYVDDYAFLILGLIELYEATFDVAYLKNALELTENMIEYFWDEKSGGLYLYGNDGEALIARPKEIYDGAVPSGNSVAAYDLMKLFGITGDVKFQKKAEEIFKTFGERVNDSPSAYTFLLLALMMDINPMRSIVIAGSKDDSTVKQALNEINKRFMPFTNTILYYGESELEKIIPDIENKKRIDQKTTFYVCENFACREPIVDFDELIKLLR